MINNSAELFSFVFGIGTKFFAEYPKDSPFYEEPLSVLS
ncbi:hypothetical protein NTGM5_70120 [Candidatus Nitrotoga sp. M5]|nr:hypothetical protein NTGM5_70120 [Candidatus Nitrotoga sp. M5]